ncbi:superinfection immunity protein [Leekyejoonella antrihumi]|nr:superinfection immunity protein [Leekyejoonella antrihumi]
MTEQQSDSHDQFPRPSAPPTSPVPLQTPAPHHNLEPYPQAPTSYSQAPLPPQLPPAWPPAPPAYPQGGYPGPYGPPVMTQVMARPPVSTAVAVLAWIVAAITLLYMLPWAVAVTRNRSNMAAIGLVNLLLGWSFIGWVVSLVMACGSEPQSTVVVNNYQGPGYPYPGR